MSAPHAFDPIRASFIARLADALGPARLPGGDLTAWVAPLPTAALAIVTMGSPERVRETLFVAIGAARLNGLPGIDQNLFEGSSDNVPHGPLANAALNAWATCVVARERLSLGLAADARRIVGFAAPASLAWPEAVARRFLPQLAALHDEAERALVRHLADEVA